MARLQPTALESALLEEFHTLYAKDGFPNPREITLVNRENTGGGRYVELSVPSANMCRDGHLDLGGKYINMEGVPNGMMAVILVSRRQPSLLEIAVYGDHSWDGVERQWGLKG